MLLELEQQYGLLKAKGVDVDALALNGSLSDHCHALGYFGGLLDGCEKELPPELGRWVEGAQETGKVSKGPVIGICSGLTHIFPLQDNLGIFSPSRRFP